MIKWYLGGMLLLTSCIFFVVVMVYMHLLKEPLLGKVTYEIEAMRMKGNEIIVDEGWEPFAVETMNGDPVIYVKRRIADGYTDVESKGGR